MTKSYLKTTRYLALAALIMAPVACDGVPDDSDGLDEIAEAELELRVGEGGGHRGGKHGRRIREALGLSEAQHEQIRALKDEMKAELTDVRDELSTLRDEMAELWRGESPDRQGILDKHEQMEPLRQKKRLARIDFRLAVLELLTPEQRELLTDMMAQRRKGRGW